MDATAVRPMSHSKRLFLYSVLFSVPSIRLSRKMISVCPLFMGQMLLDPFNGATCFLMTVAVFRVIQVSHSLVRINLFFFSFSHLYTAIGFRLLATLGL